MDQYTSTAMEPQHSTTKYGSEMGNQFENAAKKPSGNAAKHECEKGESAAMETRGHISKEHKERGRGKKPGGGRSFEERARGTRPGHQLCLKPGEERRLRIGCGVPVAPPTYVLVAAVVTDEHLWPVSTPRRLFLRRPHKATIGILLGTSGSSGYHEGSHQGTTQGHTVPTVSTQRPRAAMPATPRNDYGYHQVAAMQRVRLVSADDHGRPVR